MCSLFIAALSFLYLEEAPATIKSTELQSENPKTNEKEESSYEIVTKYLFKNTTMWALCFTGLLQVNSFEKSSQLFLRIFFFIFIQVCNSNWNPILDDSLFN